MSKSNNNLIETYQQTIDFQSWRIKEQQEEIWKLQDEIRELKMQLEEIKEHNEPRNS